MARTITITVEARSFFEQVNTLLELHDEERVEDEIACRCRSRCPFCCIALVLDFEQSEVEVAVDVDVDVDVDVEVDEANCDAAASGAKIFDMRARGLNVEGEGAKGCLCRSFDNWHICPSIGCIKLSLDMARWISPATATPTAS